ncbi:hypothetical protein RI835_004138 [Providencia rettgeri]|uniref:hypothetical protein n=1 Tax=Providencia TaxID=586 RepID=UPI0013A79050|nr:MULTISPECIES: hypothetical protein [Providencia]ELR5254869.1 hypothetical protein [Providencia rettgeri]ELR5298056.1 hypothetical protein [Providencia rettgeri]QIC15349.1 hypothetical protein G3341_06330 [Providencia vermicola]
MKVKLLNDGGYSGHEGFAFTKKFPIIANLMRIDGGISDGLAYVSGEEMINIGCVCNRKEVFNSPFSFYIGYECEIINE